MLPFVSNQKATALLLGHMEEHSKKKATKRDLPVHPPNQQVANFSLNYLNSFGYLTNELSQWSDISLGDIVAAIGDFQKMAGLKATKKLCVRTVRTMQLPRCGCPDNVRDWHPYAKVRDFINTNLPRWQKTSLAYAIQDYLPNFSKTDFESIVYQCFQNWCRLGNIDVNPTKTSQADILVSNGRGQPDNFDGPGGVLAWAYMPDGNDQQLLMKFDLDENWTSTPTATGILVDAVGTHEFGHLLGLSHSTTQTALMAPYYNAAIRTPQMQDDIPRFQARYGVRTPSTPTPTPTPAPSPSGDQLVINGTFSSVTLGGRKIA